MMTDDRNMKSLCLHAGVLAVGLIAAAGCANSNATDDATPGKTGQAAAASSWVLAPAKANGSGVEVRYQVPESIAPGQAATVRLQLSSAAVGSSVQLTLRAGGPDLL